MTTSKLERLARRIGVPELARRVGRSPSAVYGWLRKHKVPAGAADVVRGAVKRSEDARRRARERAERERLEQERAEREKRKRAKERAAKKKAEEAEAAKRAKEAAAKKKAEEEQRAKEQAERERLAREERERAEAKRKADAERQQRRREREAERRRAEEAEAERRRAEEAARPPRRPPAPPRAPAPAPPPPPPVVRVLTREQAEALRAAGLTDAFPWREETQDERDAREEREAIQAEAERESRVTLIQRRIFEWAKELPVSRGVSAMRFVDDGLVGTRRRETVLGLLVFRYTEGGSLANKFDAGHVELAWATRAGFDATKLRLDEVEQLQRWLIDWARGQYNTVQHEVTRIHFDRGQLVGTDEFGTERRAFVIAGGAANVALSEKIARTPKLTTAFNQPKDGVTLYWEVAAGSLEALRRGVDRREEEYEDLSPRTTVTDFSQLWEGKRTVTTDFSDLWEDEE